jgi:hypothetical protein
VEKSKYMFMSCHQTILWKCDKVQIFGNDINKSGLHSWRN